MGETIFAEIAKLKFPPEVREAVSKLAVGQAREVIIKSGIAKGKFVIDENHFPQFGADNHVRMGHDFGAAAGLSAENVDLVPRPSLPDLVRQLQPELAKLIGTPKG